MITEVMALLIAVGAIMIFIVWNQAKKRKQNVEERREVEESTGKLKQELEKTANEVITRMESQVSNLEDLLDESEKNRTVLEGRVAELRKLLKRSEGQSTEIRDLLTKLEEAGDTVEELQRRLEATEKKIAMSMQVQVPQVPMQMPMQSSMMPMSTPMMTPMTQPMMTPPPIMSTPLPNVPSPISPPPILSSRQSTTPPLVSSASSVASNSTKSNSTTATKTKATAATEPPTKNMDKAEIKKALEKASTAESDKAEPKDFAKVLEKSMAEDKSDPKSEARVARVPDRRSIVVSSSMSQRATVVEKTEPIKIESKRVASETPRSSRTTSTTETTSKDKAPLNNSAKIKEMLLDGMSVEDIARETGLGRGAVELVQEMTRRKLERK